MIGNRDGKFIERFVPGLLSAAVAVVIALGGQALGFWSDSKVRDRETVSAITRLNKEVEDLKRSDENSRQKTSELQADVKVLLAIMQRIERAVDARVPR